MTRPSPISGGSSKDQKTIRGIVFLENGPAIRKTCAKFVDLCRRIGVLKGAVIAVDRSKFKAVNNEAPNATGSREGPNDRNVTKGKIASRLAHLEAEVSRYIDEADRIDRQETVAARTECAAHLTGRSHRICKEIECLLAMEEKLTHAPDGQI